MRTELSTAKENKPTVIRDPEPRMISQPILQLTTMANNFLISDNSSNLTIPTTDYGIFQSDSTEYDLNQTDNDYVNTCLEHAPTFTKNMMTKVIILAIMTGLSSIGNLATIYSVTRHKQKNSNSAVYTLIFHLSIADLLVTMFCLTGEAIWTYQVAWIWGNIACKIMKFLQVFSLYLSTFILVLIGIDRFVAVKYPMKSLNTAHRCKHFVILIWILSIVLAAPQIIIFRVVRGPFVEEFYQCVTYGFYTEFWQEQLYISLSLFFMFLLPLSILIVTYVCTVSTIARSVKMFQSESFTEGQNRMNNISTRKRLLHRAKNKSLKISLVIVAAFVIWWTPYYTMMIVFMFFDPDAHFSQELASAIFFFGMSNSVINPLIYGAFHLCPRKKLPNRRRTDGLTIQHRSTSTKVTSIRESLEIKIPFLLRNSNMA